ncbi:MAG: DUF4397 domain-containing protein [Myxococcales bacterium]|nr:DUF4397 domain-containing protein [Myxococcales bacterium]
MTRYWLAFGVMGLVAACSGDEEDKATDTAMADADTDADADADADTDADTDVVDNASIRVLHLGPDAPGVDVFVDDGTPAAISDLGFTEGIDYVDLPEATYNFKVSVTGQTPGDAVLDADVPLTGGTRYAAVAHGYLADSDLVLSAFVENTEGIPAGNTRLHVVHAASRTPQVDIWNVTDPSNPTPLLTDVDYGADADLDVPAGAYDIGFDATDDGVPDLVYSVPDLGADTYVSVYAVNSGPDATAFDVNLVAHLPDGTTATIAPNPPPASIRVLHLGPDAPGVDVFVNDGTPAAVSDLGFTEGIDYVELAEDTYNFKVSVTGQTPGDAVLSADVPLTGGASYAAVAHGYIADKTLVLSAFVENVEGIPAGNTRLHVVHAAARTPQVDIWNVTDPSNPSPLLTDVDYGAEADVDVPAGAYDIGFDATDDGVPDLVYSVPNLGADTYVSVYAVNPGPSATAFDVNLVAHLADGSTVTLTPNAE